MAQNGVRSVNRFDLLDDEAPRKANKPKAVAVKAAVASAPRQERRNDRRGGHGGHGGGRGRGGHGHGRGPRRDGDRAPKREYDRHSATGRGNRRGHENNNRNSKASWGGDGIDEFKKTQGEAVAAETAPAVEPVEGEEKKTETGEPVEPEEPPTKTYEEAMEEKRKAYVAPSKDVRSVDNAEFKGKSVAPMKKKSDESMISSKKKKKKQRGRQIISLDEFAGEPKAKPERQEFRGGRGRGGRGRGRGRGGRGANRPRRGNQFNASLKDDSSFPGLA